MVDIIKIYSDIVGNFFTKEIELTIVQLAHRLFRVGLLHHVCLLLHFFLFTLSIQQVKADQLDS